MTEVFLHNALVEGIDDAITKLKEAMDLIDVLWDPKWVEELDPHDEDHPIN